MTKRTTYAIFIAKFLFSLGLIFWTIKMTMSANVGADDDNTFFSTYHKIDDNFNKISAQNDLVKAKYKVILNINGKEFDGLSYDDIFLSQRIVKKRLDRRSILNTGNNNISIKVIDKKTNKEIKNYKAEVLFTTTVNHEDDLKVELKDGLNRFKISKKSYWNIMGKIIIDNKIGHFYLKTNSK
jgi:hypothetical protein